MNLRTLAVFALCVAPMGAQSLNINLDHLASRAREKAEITLDGAALSLLKSADSEKLLDKVSRVLIRAYEFDQPGQYSSSDIENIRKQLTGSGWSRIVNMREDGESAEIYVFRQNGNTTGFVLIAAEDKELAVIHIQGSADTARIMDVFAAIH